MISTKSCWMDVNAGSSWVISPPKGWQVTRECWGEGGRLISSTEGKQGVMLGSCVRSGAPVCRTGKGMGRD